MDETTGRSLRRLRDQRGMSLSELARRSGVGKGTVSELENDRRGARLDTLFALTTALDAPLGALLPNDATTVSSQAGTVSGTSVRATLLDQWDVPAGLVEVYRATLSVDEQHSDAHAVGVEETVTVVSGRVVVGPAGASRELGVGESLRYPGDRAHRFRAVDGPAEVVLLMHYPTRTEGTTDHDR